MNDKLKPCPFCGGKVYPVYWSKTNRHYIYHYASEKSCTVDKIEFKDSIKSLADVIEAWNRRSEDERSD